MSTTNCASSAAFTTAPRRRFLCTKPAIIIKGKKKEDMGIQDNIAIPGSDIDIGTR
jgi:hypothetical protein